MAKAGVGLAVLFQGDAVIVTSITPGGPAHMEGTIR
jgi:hypothetical protein